MMQLPSLQYVHANGKGCCNQALGHHHNSCVSVPPPLAVLWNIPLQSIMVGLVTDASAGHVLLRYSQLTTATKSWDHKCIVTSIII